MTVHAETTQHKQHVFAAPAPLSRGERVLAFGTIALTVLSVLPVLTVLYLALGSAGDNWRHLIETVLPGAVWTTILLLVGVGALTLVVGVGTAWLVTMCRFPGRRFFDLALLLPLAVPTYIIAFSYVEILDYTGVVQSTLRSLFGFQTSRDYWFPEVRSLGGAIFVMGFVLYPYVYLTSRASFLIQSAGTLDVSRTLGAGPLRLFLKVALPLARPAIAVGVTLALMECLNDIGTVTFFGVKTLTFSVYETWLNRSSLTGAAQLASVMLLIVFGLIWLEHYARRRQRFYQSNGSETRALPSYALKGLRGWMAVLACALPILFGFVFPALLLLSKALRRREEFFNPDLWQAANNTLWLSAIAAVVSIAVSLALAYTRRLNPSPLTTNMGRLASIGYAVPGTILAVGILFPVAALDNAVANSLRDLFGISTGLILLGSGTALIYAYVVRFLAVSYGQIDSGFGKISPHLDMASRTLGQSALGTLAKVHMPLMKPVLSSAMLLAFVECMKELPATLLLRPFNFDTLATTVFTAASREAFEDAALPALLIVLVGVVPVVLLARTTVKTFRQKQNTRSAALAPAVVAPESA
ncbi:iron ABC transporter permease [Pseudovibrio exalbescens]|uniref:ABC transporter permease n=1 Tax=Pseudovibrio exalbescens TaxID=197461 RepID=UPI0023672306|nr:iron ABC transporter permease [Pseudovibrio exalbescens]MDD7912121.1 iron ABC transporter permease [Pseudovibrio exalbescens]